MSSQRIGFAPSLIRLVKRKSILSSAHLIQRKVSMKNLAEFLILGRVGKVAKVGAAIKIDIAANYARKNKDGDWQDDPHWNTITVFDEFVAKYVNEEIGKGDLVLARGRMRQNRFEKNGQTVFVVDLVCSDFSRLSVAGDVSGVVDKI
jgi:single-strand DNA-binding protein